MNSIAVMQPYFLPYIGYFQLIAAVDKFVVFDDVNFIKRGWINRNRILLNGSPHLFTLPVQSASQHRHICDLKLVGDGQWRTKLWKTFSQAYSRAPYFQETSDLIRGIIQYEVDELDVFVANSIEQLTNHLGIKTRLLKTSRIYGNSHLVGQDRILDICVREAATTYINAIGGVELYDGDLFAGRGVDLKFLRTNQISYSQSCPVFIDKLSIVDVLMFNGRDATISLLSHRELLSNQTQ